MALPPVSNFWSTSGHVAVMMERASEMYVDASSCGTALALSLAPGQDATTEVEFGVSREI